MLSVFQGRPLEEQLSRVQVLVMAKSTRDAAVGVIVDADREPRLDALKVANLVRMVASLRNDVSLAREFSAIEI